MFSPFFYSVNIWGGPLCLKQYLYKVVHPVFQTFNWWKMNFPTALTPDRLVPKGHSLCHSPCGPMLGTNPLDKVFRGMLELDFEMFGETRNER